MDTQAGDVDKVVITSSSALIDTLKGEIGAFLAKDIRRLWCRTIQISMCPQFQTKVWLFRYYLD